MPPVVGVFEGLPATAPRVAVDLNGRALVGFVVLLLLKKNEW